VRCAMKALGLVAGQRRRRRVGRERPAVGRARWRPASLALDEVDATELLGGCRCSGTTVASQGCRVTVASAGVFRGNADAVRVTAMAIDNPWADPGTIPASAWSPKRLRVASAEHRRSDRGSRVRARPRPGRTMGSGDSPKYDAVREAASCFGRGCTARQPRLWACMSERLSVWGLLPIQGLAAVNRTERTRDPRTHS
jgi:hypothetical protein